PLLGRTRDAVVADDDDLITDVRDGVAAEDHEVTQRSARISQLELAALPDADADDEPLQLDPLGHRPRPYSETLERLAPDGSAIDTPLTIFSELPEDALSELVRRMSLRSFGAGDIVLREGDPGDACFIIASGSVRVLKRAPANQRSELIEVARLGAG